jgi:hypothetical protein
LSPATNPKAISGQLEVALDDGALISRHDTASSRNTRSQMWEDFVSFMRRAIGATQQKGVE